MKRIMNRFWYSLAHLGIGFSTPRFEGKPSQPRPPCIVIHLLGVKSQIPNLPTIGNLFQLRNTTFATELKPISNNST